MECPVVRAYATFSFCRITWVSVDWAEILNWIDTKNELEGFLTTIEINSTIYLSFTYKFRNVLSNFS